MEADPTRMCELLVGLGDVELVRIDDPGEGAPLEVVIHSRKPRPSCEACGGRVWSKGYRSVVLVDLPAFGRPVRLRWRKRRWTCPNPGCRKNPCDRAKSGWKWSLAVDRRPTNPPEPDPYPAFRNVR